jgi:hypothetical protein
LFIHGLPLSLPDPQANRLKCAASGLFRWDRCTQCGIRQEAPSLKSKPSEIT